MDLTPEEANAKIEKLNKQIAEWRNITENLGKFIKVEKMACLATTGIVNLMNLVSGASGEAPARQEHHSSRNQEAQAARKGMLDSILVYHI